MQAKIINLHELPEAAGPLEDWFMAEWEPWYGPNGADDARSDILESLRGNTLPVCLIAIGAGDELLGTASLRAHSVGNEIDDGPWLSAVLVRGENKNQGLGTALVKAIETEARHLGFQSICTSTDSAAGIMVRLGWIEIGETKSLRGQIRVFKKDLM